MLLIQNIIQYKLNINPTVKPQARQINTIKPMIASLLEYLLSIGSMGVTQNQIYSNIQTILNIPGTGPGTDTGVSQINTLIENIQQIGIPTIKLSA